MGTAVCTVIEPCEAPKKRTWTAIAPISNRNMVMPMKYFLASNQSIFGFLNSSTIINPMMNAE